MLITENTWTGRPAHPPPVVPTGFAPSTLSGGAKMGTACPGAARLHPMAARAGGPIRVLLVDDQQVVLQGLRSIIQETDDLCVVGETHDAGRSPARP